MQVSMLNPLETNILKTLLSLSEGTIVNATNDRLAQLLNCDPRTVSGCLRKLNDKGMIKLVYLSKKKRVIHLE